MKVLSWNVAGIRAVIKKDCLNKILDENADVICFQETKVEEQQLKSSVDAYKSDYPFMFWNSTKLRKGLHGTSIWSKIKPISISYGLPTLIDQEGRVITIELDSSFIINVYTPNSKMDLSRLESRVNDWDNAMIAYCKSLKEKKSIILCGDMNVCHLDIDIHNAQQNRNKVPGFTDLERDSFTEYMTTVGLNDVHRKLHGLVKKEYTWWTYLVKYARTANLGWRLDYFLVSDDIMDTVKTSIIHREMLGSDHCPISFEF